MQSLDTDWMARLTYQRHHTVYNREPLELCFEGEIAEGVLAESLYFGLWRWMQEPNKIVLEKIMFALKTVCRILDERTLPNQQVYPFYNALLWLTLFCPARDMQLETVLQKLTLPSGKVYLPFGLEALFVRYCIALRDENENLARSLHTELRNHPLWDSEELFFPLLTRALANEPCEIPENLETFFRELKHTILRQKMIGGSKINVVLSEAIVHIANAKPVRSQAITIALGLLKSRSSVPAEEFCRKCFGLVRYEPLIHLPKIYNLLSRIKALGIEGITFGLKAATVYAHGEWGNVTFCRAGELSCQLNALDWSKYLPPPANGDLKPIPKRTFSAPRKIAWNGQVKRSELETILGRPRSTTSRILSRWMKRGVVLRSGNARNTRYQMHGVTEIRC